MITHSLRIFQAAQPADYEIFSGLIPGGETMRRVTTLDHAFELRSVDMQFRVRLAGPQAVTSCTLVDNEL